MSWSLEKELSEVLGTDTLEASLKSAGILSSTDSLTSIDVGDWKRGGAETYIFPFSVYGSSRTKRSFLLKAYTPSIGGVSLERSFERMFAKRDQIGELGIASPRVYVRYNAAWIEDYVDFSIGEFLREPHDINSKYLVVEKIRRAIGLLIGAGYAPIAPIDDFRTDGSELFLIDFGADLGSPVNNVNPSQIWSKVTNWFSTSAPEFAPYFHSLMVNAASANETH